MVTIDITPIKQVENPPTMLGRSSDSTCRYLEILTNSIAEHQANTKYCINQLKRIKS